MRSDVNNFNKFLTWENIDDCMINDRSKFIDDIVKYHIKLYELAVDEYKSKNPHLVHGFGMLEANSRQLKDKEKKEILFKICKQYNQPNYFYNKLS